MAEEIGVTRTTIGRYEKGELEMPASTLPLISEVCGFPFASYMEDYDLFTTTEKTRDALRPAFSFKSVYPPPEWRLEEYMRERDRNSLLLSGCKKDIDRKCNSMVQLLSTISAFIWFKWFNVKPK